MQRKKQRGRINRRDFLKAAGAAAGLFLEKTGVFVSPAAAAPVPRQSARSSRIVRVRSDGVWQDALKPSAGVVRKMLSAGIRVFTGKDADDEAWGSLFSPDDVVGIKLSALGGARLSSNRELTDSIIEGLLAAGVKENNIIVWERFAHDLPALGFKRNTGSKGVRCYTSEVFGGSGGRGYDPDVFIQQGDVRAPVSMIVTRDVTALINVPVLKDHEVAGITNTLKNIAFGSLHNTNKLHGNGCDPAIADACALPQIRGKLRLCVVDALRCVYDGGPLDSPRHKWNQNEIHVGADMVALDAIGWEIIEAKRAENGLRSLERAGRKPVHVLTAEKRGLGTTDMKNVDVREVRM
ncbi:MAG: DUF362 domain-containing protein [bacterium]